MYCNVTIKGAEGTGDIFSPGDITFTDNGFYLTYSIAKDKCVLSARGSTITQSRRGKLNTDITFVKNKRTVCMLLSGELTGDIPVNTLSLNIEKGEWGVKVNIVYMLAGAKIDLRLAALILKEKQ